MIILHRDKARGYKIGEVLHFRVVSLEQRNPGRWHLTVEDITPLPGAEPQGYACGVCGIVEEAKSDGSLPEGWIEKEDKDKRGSHWRCKECRDI